MLIFTSSKWLFLRFPSPCKKSPSKIPPLPQPLTAIWKTLLPFFNIQADYVVYIKKYNKIHTKWVTWELKTPLLNNELTELDHSTNSNILLWILCDVITLFMVAIFEIYFLLRRSFCLKFWNIFDQDLPHCPQLIVKCHWEIQKPLGDSCWNIKWELYNEINWFTHYGWLTKKKMWLGNLKKKSSS